MESTECLDAVVDFEDADTDPSLMAIEFSDKREIKEIITILLEKCKKECDNNELEIPLHNYTERVSFYSGYSLSVINNFFENLEYPSSQVCSINPSGRIEIYKSVKDFYLKKTSPTIEDIYEAVKKKINIVTKADFEHEMRLMGYNYRNTPKRKVLVEDPNITFKRFFYLNKLKKVREKCSKHIYYIDERLIDFSFTFPKIWVKNIDVSSPIKNGSVFLYLLSNNSGFMSGLFCNPLTVDDYKKWIMDIILGLLAPNSVVIMNDNPLFNDKNVKTLSKYDTKYKMFHWLRENNIPCRLNMRKAELYELIRKCPKQVNKCKIDQIFNAHGHEVMWLPLHLHDFPPTEGLWQYLSVMLKSEEKNLSLNPEDQLDTLTNQILTRLSKISQEYWNNLEKDATNQENQLYEIDAGIDNILDKLLSNTV